MDAGAPPKVSLNGPLVEQAQATLARMRVGERAYTLLKSRGAQRLAGGLGRLAARRTRHGAGVRSCQWRKSRHRARAGFLHLQRLLCGPARPHDDDRRRARQGQLGARAVGRTIGGEAAVRPDCFPIFSTSTAAISSPPGMWRSPIWRCVRCSPIGPNISRSAPPRRRPRRSGRFSNRSANETALTRERAAAPAAQDETKCEAKTIALRKAEQRLSTTAREAVDLALKSQRRAGEPAPDDARRVDRGLFQADPDPGRRRRRLAADRRAARQPQRTLSPADAGGDQSRAIEARARTGRGGGREPALQRDAAAAAARRHDGKGRATTRPATRATARSRNSPTRWRRT